MRFIKLNQRAQFRAGVYWTVMLCYAIAVMSLVGGFFASWLALFGFAMAFAAALLESLEWRLIASHLGVVAMNHEHMRLESEAMLVSS